MITGRRSELFAGIAVAETDSGAELATGLGGGGKSTSLGVRSRVVGGGVLGGA